MGESLIGMNRPVRRHSRLLWITRANPASWFGIACVLLMVGAAVVGPYLVPYPQDAGPVVDFGARLQAPSAAHFFGTDVAGRDLFSRVIIASRTSLLIGLFVVALGSVIGVTFGLLAGYYGGIVNLIMMRIADVFLAIPSVALALAITVVLRPSTATMTLAIAMVWWPWMARLVQSQVLSIKEEAFVDASRIYGASDLHIILHDILPNVTSLIVVKVTIDIGFAILIVAALGFLGVGPPAPTPEWGSMINSGRQVLPSGWWLSTFPGIAIFISVLGFSLLGDTIRDFLDVRYAA